MRFFIILCDADASIHDDTLIIIDPTDIQKEYAERMPSLAKVWERVGDLQMELEFLSG